MSTHDGRYTIVFNGEIYNYREIRRTLEANHGVCFTSESDTEVLLQSWAHWGEASLDLFVGMFAFAILDRTENRLVLARDPFGIKPLYMVQSPQGLAFCSEVGPLLKWPGLKRTVDPQGAVDYLRYGFTDHLEQTLVSPVRQVMPGEVCSVDPRRPNELAKRTYWRASPRDGSHHGFQESAAHLRDLLAHSVELHLRSDVPIASCLSGGIDSSSLVCLMRELGGPSIEIHTFSHIVPGTSFDEQRWMDDVSQRVDAVQHKVQTSPSELIEDLTSLIRAQQAPFTSTSIFAQYKVFEAIHRSGIKVSLDGQGADELFGGYGYHIGARLASLVRQRKWAKAWRFAQKAGPTHSLGVGHHVANMAGYLLSSGQDKIWRKLVGRGETPSWLDSGWCGRHGAFPHSYRTVRSSECLRETLGASLSRAGLSHLLRYEDRNSMAFSVESRVPFLSKPLVEFALSLPEEWLVSPEGITKAILRQSMRGLVPDSVLDRKDKIAFQTPENAWMKTLSPWIDRVLRSDRARSVAPLYVDKALELWRQIQEGYAPYSPAVWRWANMVEWAEAFDVEFPV